MKNSPYEQEMSALELGRMGNKLMKMGRWDEAEKCYLTALEKEEKTDDQHGEADTYFNIGHLYFDQGDQSQAHIHFEKGKALYEMVGDSHMAQKVVNTQYSTF